MTRADRPVWKPATLTVSLAFVAGALVGILADRPAASVADLARDVSWGSTVAADPFAHAAADDLWAACVWGRVVAPEHGSDADVAECDRHYAALTGITPEEAGLHLWCPGAPVHGGCYGTRDDLFS